MKKHMFWLFALVFVFVAMPAMAGKLRISSLGLGVQTVRGGTVVSGGLSVVNHRYHPRYSDYGCGQNYYGAPGQVYRNGGWRPVYQNPPVDWIDVSGPYSPVYRVPVQQRVIVDRTPRYYYEESYPQPVEVNVNIEKRDQEELDGLYQELAELRAQNEYLREQLGMLQSPSAPSAYSSAESDIKSQIRDLQKDNAELGQAVLAKASAPTRRTPARLAASTGTREVLASDNGGRTNTGWGVTTTTRKVK